MIESDGVIEAGESVSAGLSSGKLPPQLRGAMFLAAAENEACCTISAGLTSGKRPPQLRVMLSKTNASRKGAPEAEIFKQLPEAQISSN